MTKSLDTWEGNASVPQAASPLEAGRVALARGAWSEARAAFSRVTEDSSAPRGALAEAWAGLGLAWYWLGDGAEAGSAYERAFGLCRELGRVGEAARAALWLADIQLGFFGAPAVANGWIGRAERLLSDHPSEEERLWLLAYRGHLALLYHGDAPTALEFAREGQVGAQELSASDAEVVLLALEGLARVQLGEVAEGIARLDEASAEAVARGLEDLNAVAWTCCYQVHGCEWLRDLLRAREWCRRVLAFCEEWGLAPVYASCRIDYAAVLTWRGAWDDAENELEQAVGGMARAASALEHLRSVRLAELRRRQGRLDEAEELLDPAGEDPLAVVGRAAIALDRGRWNVARDLSDRALRLLSEASWTDRVDALLIRVRAAAALGDPASAEADARELEEAANRAGTAFLRGIAARARGTAARARGDQTAAREALEEAVAWSDRGGAPLEAAQARLELAEALRELGRSDTASLEAARARETFASLGALRDLERAEAFLRSPTRASHPLTRREVEVLALMARGWSNRRIAKELYLSPHTVKRHVANILRKLECPSRAAAVAQGARLGLPP